MFDGENENISLHLICEMNIFFGNTKRWEKKQQQNLVTYVEFEPTAFVLLVNCFSLWATKLP